jgi:ribose transport system substrate-binding protein
MKANADLKVVSDNQYGGATTESAFHGRGDLLVSLKAATRARSNGVFAPNESTTFGMLLALEKAQLAGKVKFLGLRRVGQARRAL